MTTKLIFITMLAVAAANAFTLKESDMFPKNARLLGNSPSKPSKPSKANKDKKQLEKAKKQAERDQKSAGKVIPGLRKNIQSLQASRDKELAKAKTPAQRTKVTQKYFPKIQAAQKRLQDAETRLNGANMRLDNRRQSMGLPALLPRRDSR